MAELVLALDVPDRTRADALLAQFQPAWIKVGSVLFTAAGPGLVADLARRGVSVFLDLKWHDIPNTVRGALAGARGLGVRMVTVHALGGPDMIAAAREAAAGELAVVAVTVLTSHTDASWRAVVGGERSLPGEVERLAGLALDAGADGLVCSPLEVGLLRRRFGPGPLLVTPGIRGAGAPRGDQSRVATAREAVDAGATHLVVGRPVLEAPDPAAAWSALAREAAR